MTEQNIKEGLEQELRLADYVDSSYCNNVPRVLIKNTLAYINNLQTEKEKLEYILMGVMHSVDKWLEGDELNHDETNRAVIMREKTLQIVEKQKAEIERLSKKGVTND